MGPIRGLISILATSETSLDSRRPIAAIVLKTEYKRPKVRSKCVWRKELYMTYPAIMMRRM
jgi:hypothetical protein